MAKNNTFIKNNQIKIVKPEQKYAKSTIIQFCIL